MHNGGVIITTITLKEAMAIALVHELYLHRQDLDVIMAVEDRSLM
jgi:hypothetical protein